MASRNSHPMANSAILLMAAAPGLQSLLAIVAIIVALGRFSRGSSDSDCSPHRSVIRIASTVADTPIQRGFMGPHSLASPSAQSALYLYG
jgi:hypothetical protein